MAERSEIRVNIVAPDTFTFSTTLPFKQEDISAVDEALRLMPLLEATVIPVPFVIEPNRIAM